MSDCCPDFTRSQLLRRGIAQAGQGLPSIEPGMPLPAGTGLERRSFLLRTAGLALTIYGAARIAPGAFEEGIAAAAGSPQNVIVSLFLPGGADSLSILAPVGDPAYAGLRPTLALAPGSGVTFAEDHNLMWAPAAASLATLHGEGKVTVMPGIGYDHPDQSHFTSRHYWEVGQTDASARLGWLGRYLDLTGSATNPLQGLSLDGELQPALAAGSVPIATVSSPADYQFWSENVWSPIQQPMLDALGSLGNAPAVDPTVAYARTAQRNAALLRGQLAPFSSFTSPVPYPAGDLGVRLAGLAALLGAGLPLRCVALSDSGGYDTHSDEAIDLAAQIGAASNAILAFQRDLESRGLADRVLLHVWTEFGRRPEENGSRGTDHGAGGVSFLIGTQAKGTMVGEFPGLASLDEDDNLKSTLDFRSVYCSLLEQWLAFDAARVIPGAASFARPALVK